MPKNLDIKLILSMIIVGLVWGTTYLGIRVAVETIPPWYATTLRQGIASLILLFTLLYQKKLEWVGWEKFKFLFISSVLMIVIANGFTTIAEKTIPSALTAVLCSLSPLIVYVFSLLFNLQKSSWKSWIGVLVGFSGVVFLFRNGLKHLLDENNFKGIILITIAITSWSWATVYTKLNTHLQVNIFLNLFYIFGIGTIIQFFLALLFNPNPEFSSWSYRSIGAIIYLALFGSLIAFFCYNYALKKVAAIQVSILNYINTVIAIFLGWLVLDETITTDFIIATCLIVLGIVITNYKKHKKIPT